MSAIIWDEIGKHFYETGVSKGVFYDSDGYGVAWNGLTSIEENTKNEVQSIYFDGMKINDFVNVGDFSGTLKAFTYPDEFLPYEGILQEGDGVLITGQLINRFGLCYQTKIGNDVAGTAFGYKVHVLYNLTADPVQRTYKTMALDIEPQEFEWSITSIPEYVDNFRPTAHIIFDSTKIDSNLLSNIEAILYGSTYEDPQLPTLKTLINYIRE